MRLKIVQALRGALSPSKPRPGVYVYATGASVLSDMSERERDLRQQINLLARNGGL